MSMNNETINTKHFDNSTGEIICLDENGKQNNTTAVAIEEGLLNAMNNFQIASVKKLQRSREPIISCKDFPQDNSEIIDKNKAYKVENTTSQSIECEIKNMSDNAMSLLSSIQHAKKITETVSSSSSSLSKSKFKVNVSMNQSSSRHIVKKISNTMDGAQLKEEKINFFGIPITVNRKKRTQVIPFNFQYKTKENKKSHELSTKCSAPLKSTCCKNNSATTTSQTAVINSLQINRKIHNDDKILSTNNVESQKINQMVNKIDQIKSHNLTMKKSDIKTSSNNNKNKIDKENHTSINRNVNEWQEVKSSKPIAAGIRLMHTEKRAKDREEFEAKMKQRALQIEEMRTRVEQKKREKEKAKEIGFTMKLMAKAKPMSGPVRSTKAPTQPQNPPYES